MFVSSQNPREQKWRKFTDSTVRVLQDRNARKRDRRLLGQSKSDLERACAGGKIDLNTDNASQQTHSNAAGQPFSQGVGYCGVGGNSIVSLEITIWMHVTEEVSHNDTFAPFWVVSLAMWRTLLDLSKTEFEHFA